MNLGIVLAESAENGILTNETRERINVGIKFLENHFCDQIILSGGIKKRQDHRNIIGNYPSLAYIMEGYCLEKGVLKEKIILEDLSEDTVGQLIFLKQGILIPRGIKGGVMITHDWHLPRVMEESKIILGGYNFNYFGITSNKEIPTETSLKKFYKIFQKIDFSNNPQVLDTLLGKHHFYNHSPKFYRAELKKMIEKNSK